MEVGMSEKIRSAFWQRPTTRLGWWAVGLAIGWLGFNIGSSIIVNIRSRMPSTSENIVLINYGLLMLLVGLAAGIVALIALLRKSRRERSWLVWASLLPGLMVIALLIGEFTIPH
jgi:ammonia channel protein AmtB